MAEVGTALPQQSQELVGTCLYEIHGTLNLGSMEEDDYAASG